MCKNKSTVTEDENTLPDINLQGKQLSDLRCSLILYLENNGYAEKTIHRYNHELDLLQVMMNEKGVIYYTTDIGEQFCQQRSQAVNDYGLQITIKRIIFRLNCLLQGKPIAKQVYSQVMIPIGHRDVLFDFLQKCIADGNAKITVSKKDYYAKRFFCLNAKSWGLQDTGIISAYHDCPRRYTWRVDSCLKTSVFAAFYEDRRITILLRPPEGWRSQIRLHDLPPRFCIDPVFY